MSERKVEEVFHAAPLLEMSHPLYLKQRYWRGNDMTHQGFSFTNYLTASRRTFQCVSSAVSKQPAVIRLSSPKCEVSRLKHLLSSSPWLYSYCSPVSSSRREEPLSAGNAPDQPEVPSGKMNYLFFTALIQMFGLPFFISTLWIPSSTSLNDKTWFMDSVWRDVRTQDAVCQLLSACGWMCVYEQERVWYMSWHTKKSL